MSNFVLPVSTAQDPATYKANIDADFSVSQRLMDAFAPHAQSTPDMTIGLDAGFIYSSSAALTELAAQNTTAIAASSLAGITRIDRVVINQQTGVYSVVSGTSVAPSLPYGYKPCAQIAVTTGSTAITNAMIIDERTRPPSGPKAFDYQVFTSTGSTTWTKPATGFSSLSMVIAQVWAGGGGASTIGGGGGGAFMEGRWRLGDLSTSVAVTVGNGGAPGRGGGLSLFGSLTVYGGGGSSALNTGAGGGGVYGAGSTVNNDGGDPDGGLAAGTSSQFGGGAGGGTFNFGGASVYGGGGGGCYGSAAAGPGGRSYYGGGGGGGAASSLATSQPGGQSYAGGNGGTGSPTTAGSGSNGSVPGGGGGAGEGGQGSGGRGEVRVWVFPV